MRVLLINPPYLDLYKEAKVKVGVAVMPSLTLATLAAPLLEENEVKVLDLVVAKNPKKLLLNVLRRFRPDFVGISIMTPGYGYLNSFTKFIKEFDSNIVLIGGGPHITIFPENSLEDTELDIAVIGEGDLILPEIVKGVSLKKIGSIAYKEKGKIKINRYQNKFVNLDNLPMPAWNLFDLKKYKPSKLICRQRPVGQIETSRGCVYGCTYCNKKIFGCTFRPKSAKRVVDEIQYMLKCGFKEVHTIDDGFSTNLDRAKDICKGILNRGLKLTWNVRTGMRVDRVDMELLRLMKKSGCYRISFGVESGSQQILNNVKKGTTLKRIREVFKMCHKLKIETLGFFMFGLPGESKETMQETIDFAKEIDPMIIKPGILTPLPGTPLFDEWDEKGYIKTKDWSKYNFHNPSDVYDHPDLNWKTIKRYYDKFYTDFYFRPSIVAKRFFYGLRHGTIFSDAYAFVKTKW